MTYTDLIQVLRRMKVETGSLMCLGCGHEHSCSTHGCAILREAAERIEELHEAKSELCAYKDTGLGPDEVETIKDSLIGKSIAEIKEFDGIPVERLKELAEAERDGRLVVLPCGDNVSVTRHGKTYKGDHWNMPVLTAFCKANTPRGEKVGLFSIEEVEAALETVKGAHHEKNSSI